MPELPDVMVYIEALQPRIGGETLDNIRIRSPFLVRSFEPPLKESFGKRVAAVFRLGKRIVIGLEDRLFLVLHLMIAGRLRWSQRAAGIPGRWGLAAFDFSTGSLLLTEAGSKKRASLYLVRGEDQLSNHNPGGLEILDSDLDAFRDKLVEEKHTLKRALTDPRLFSGIGNAYSDEILFQARLSPLRRTDQLLNPEVRRLFEASQTVLRDWISRLRSETGGEFPEKVTAFREGMAVHGRYRQPCPVCAAPIQRIVYSETECNYCANCQTEGRLLADRILSRLLKKDWPRTLDELENYRKR